MESRAGINLVKPKSNGQGNLQRFRNFRDKNLKRNENVLNEQSIDIKQEKSPMNRIPEKLKIKSINLKAPPIKI